ncbi:MAG: sigma 54-interacting transcriptional regulator [Polyangia bacterium]|jgi:transcriptional regulator of acetoin/glycerol metabolism|nr:sigma 54-interacting transcriptional regulator [Polyangia bacterium]
MKTELPFVSEAGWYVDLPGPAETMLHRNLDALGKAERRAADAQAWLYLMDQAKLQAALDSLAGQRGMATLARALAAENALRWDDLKTALELYQDLARLGGAARGATAAWARLRVVEVLERSGQVAEAQAQLVAALRTDADQAPVQAAVVEARLLFRAGDPAGALARLEATPPPDDRPGSIRGAWLRGQAIYTSLTGRADRALGQHTRALDCFKALGDRYMLVKQYLSLAQTFLESSELDHADLYCDKAADVLGAVPHPHLQALVKSRAGMIALLQGQLDRARTLFAEDLKLGEQAGLRPGLYYARRNLGKVLVRLGLRTEGADYLAASHQGFRDHGDPVNERLSRIEEIAARLPVAIPSELDVWLAELEAISALFERSQRPALRAQVDAVRAQVLVRQGAWPLARDLIEDVVAAWRQQHRGDRLVEFLTAVAAAYPKEHRDDAERCLRLAYREAENSGQRWAAGRVLKALDEYSEMAALDLARAPRIPTGFPVVSVPPPAEGFYDQSRSSAYRGLLDEARSVARSDITVLVLGETGVGKDWLAGYVHSHGQRADQVYRAYNCGAVAESLLEAELFGYEKGAFTGAEQSRVGIFEAADGGTVFLDEVGELSPHAQAALLRVLDQHVVQPVGSTVPREVDVRILAATNRDLAEAVRAGDFRSDLYFRLAVYILRIPPLRERIEDIPLLVQHFLGKTGDAIRRQIHTVDQDALEALMRYTWPGNLRELDNAIQSSVVRCQGQTIRRKHLPSHIAEPSSQVSLAHFTSLAEREKKAIQDALRQAHGNQSEAAKILGIHRNTLGNKIRKYGIDP